MLTSWGKDSPLLPCCSSSGSCLLHSYHDSFAHADFRTFCLEIEVNIVSVRKHFMWKRPFREIPCLQYLLPFKSHLSQIP